MASKSVIFKPWRLTKEENITTFEDWRAIMISSLKTISDYKIFLAKEAKWEKKKKSATRGMADDNDGPGAKSKEVKAEDLENMLNTIASFCPPVNRNALVDNTKCLEDVWQTIRQHYNIQYSGANFLNFSTISLEPGERHEDLYQRLATFINNNLLKKSDPIIHDDDEPKREEDELITPTLENLIVLLWLEKIDPKLPDMVKQKYASALKKKTLFNLKPEISMSIPSLLEEIQGSDIKVNKTFAHNQPGQYRKNFRQNSFRGRQQRSRQTPQCTLCKQAGRPDTSHFMSKCKYLPEQDRRYMAMARQISGIIIDNDDFYHEDDDFDPYEEEEANSDSNAHRAQESYTRTSKPASIGMVMIKTSPYIDLFHKSKAIRVTLDSGAEGDMIRKDVAISLGANIRKTSHRANHAKGGPLTVSGEVSLTFARDGREFHFSGLVVDELDADILGGVPFQDRNDISIRTKYKQVTLGDGTRYTYGATAKSSDIPTIRSAKLLRAKENTTIWPGDHIEIPLPVDVNPDLELALEPRSLNKEDEWFTPEITKSVGHNIRLTNTSNVPQVIKKHDHIAQISRTFSPDIDPSLPKAKAKAPTPFTNFTDGIKVNPDNILDDSITKAFHQLHERFNSVFNPNFGVYNHAFGHFEAKVNMGPVKPPQRKGRLPFYNREKLVLLQEHFDKWDDLNVLVDPSSVDVSIEYLNPSFLVKKPPNDHRLVTAFGEVGKYCKPQPALLPNVDSTLRTIGNWNYVIVTDLKSAYFQIPLQRESMKYCGTASPFKGTRVYTRCAMGMPGSETALEELLSKVLGDLITKGFVTKIADDLYVGGETPKDLFNNWAAVLENLHKANLTLTAPKTFVGPKEVTILGWIWKLGQIRASPHKVAPLACCNRPITVKNMRSFLGAYKMLARVIKNCSHYLHALNKATAGKTSSQKIEWTPDLENTFLKAQQHLKTCL